MKMNIMVQELVILLLVTVVISVGLFNAEDVKALASTQERKSIKAKKIIWKKDGAKMVRIPSIAFKHEKTFNRVGIT